jgi:hypothetical protein
MMNAECALKQWVRGVHQNLQCLIAYGALVLPMSVNPFGWLLVETSGTNKQSCQIEEAIVLETCGSLKSAIADLDNDIIYLRNKGDRALASALSQLRSMYRRRLTRMEKTNETR